ncbi:hypothetical protein AT291_06270 [Porphyromonas gingivalis]|nr:hypothetical protein AT291_06270 [Porphyromonas gingivalis]
MRNENMRQRPSLLGSAIREIKEYDKNDKRAQQQNHLQHIVERMNPDLLKDVPSTEYLYKVSENDLRRDCISNS